jgi:Zn-dependent protease with chaperone function
MTNGSSSASPRQSVIDADFIHPEDAAALQNLQAIPLFPQCVKMFLKLGVETQLHGYNMAQKVRLAPDQLPEIYRYLPPACDALGIVEPEFYLEMNPQPNAYTMGDSTIGITVTSGLIESMTEEEVRAVVAHECGHIACHHTLYRTMAQLLVQFGSAVFGPLAAVSMPVQLGLSYWARRSELSADRAGAVVMGSPEPMINALVRLAGGPKSITGKINLEHYQAQAEAYSKLLESQWDRLLQNVIVMHADHPLLALRARELTNWCQTERFGRLSAALAKNARQRCSTCGWVPDPEWKFCGHCGMPVPPQSACR